MFSLHARRSREILIAFNFNFHLRSVPTWSRLPCMTHAIQTRNVTGETATGVSAATLLLTDTDVKMLADDPERVIHEIEIRATQVSSVLQNILTEQHDRPDWGLND
jgi:hypothetical protein